MNNEFKNNTLVMKPFDLRTTNIVQNKAFFQKHYSFFKEKGISFCKSVLAENNQQVDAEIIKALYLKQILSTLESSDEMLQIYVQNQKHDLINKDIKEIQEEVRNVGSVYSKWKDGELKERENHAISLTKKQTDIVKTTTEFEEIWISQKDNADEQIILHATLLNLFLNDRDEEYLKNNLVEPYTRFEINLKDGGVSQYKGEIYSKGYDLECFEPWEHIKHEEKTNTFSLKELKKKWLLQPLDINLTEEEKEKTQDFLDEEINTSKEVIEINDIFTEKYLLFTIAFLIEQELIERKEVTKKEPIKNASKKKKKRVNVKRYSYLKINEEKFKKVVPKTKEERRIKEKLMVN